MIPQSLALLVFASLTIAQTHAQTPRYFGTLAGAAGSQSTSADGTGSAARFYNPRAVAMDAAGNVYVADSGNHTIRKITLAGATTTLAGTAGSQGFQDGAGSAARFGEPVGIAADSAGTVYVADTLNNAIRKITPAGVVSTLAGNGTQGSSDGSGSAARFNEPRGVAVDSAGNVYVADYQNSAIRKITPAGVVSTLAGSAGVSGSTDGAGSAARFKDPNGIAVDSAGNVYVSDTGNRTIRKITPAGMVSTLAGSATASGAPVDGTGAAARFGELRNLSVDSAGNLYVADANTHTIRRISPAGDVTTVAGSTSTPGTDDGSGTAARFYQPSGTATDSAGNVVIADTANHTIRKMTAATAVSTLAGLAGRSSSVDGTGSAARFEDPYSVAIDAAGNAYIADATDHSIRKITPTGVVTTLAGLPGSYGNVDGTGTAARFRSPYGIAVAANGTVYVADSGNGTIRAITPAGSVSTLPLTENGASLRMGALYGVAVDSAGALYIIDGNMIRKAVGNAVSTLAGSSANGLVDGNGSAARFSVPFDLTVDGAGNVYVCDHGNHAVRKITPAGTVSTLAGNGTAGNAEGTGSAARFRFPSGIAVDSGGTVYVADTDNQAIRQISANGTTTTLAGGSQGNVNGIGTRARFFNPKDVAVDAQGRLLVADRGNHTVRQGSPLSATVSADCLFDWAEANYASLFRGGGASQTASPYYYRYFADTRSYLGTATSDGKVYYLPAGGALQDVGTQSYWLGVAACQ